MKKVLISLFLSSFLFVFIQAPAQIKFGTKAGINIATLGGKEHLFTPPTYAKLTYNLGSTINFIIFKNYGLESGILLSKKGAVHEQNYQFQNGASMVRTLSFSNLFLEIPLNATYQFKVRDSYVQFFSGPYFGFGIAAKNKIKNTLYDIPEGITIDTESYPDKIVKIQYSADGYQSKDFGFNFGAGIIINKFFYKIQYGLGTTDIYHNIKSKNRVVGISIGFMFGGKNDLHQWQIC